MPADATPPAAEQPDAARAGYIAGLRALAELLERHSAIPIPDTANVHGPPPLCPFGIYGGTPALVQAVFELLGRPVAADFHGRTKPFVTFTWHLEGIALLVAADAVEPLCRRQVTGIYWTGGQPKEITDWVLADHLTPGIGAIDEL